jgi:hypothetical protein
MIHGDPTSSDGCSYRNPSPVDDRKEFNMTANKKSPKPASPHKPQRDVHIPRPGEPNHDPDESRKPEQNDHEQTDEREIIRQNAKPRSARQSLKGPNNRKQ